MTTRIRMIGWPVRMLSRHMPRIRLAVFGLLLGVACGNDPAVQIIDVALSPGQVYEHRTVGGDEEGARIVTQPRHAAVSEIRRDETTNWVAVYVYQPEAGYSGRDEAAIEVHSGSDGASAPTQVTRILFRFIITS